ncbi:MAG: hypothetical protein IT328_20090 [Caldilineaceae bacterium]|nr:hypothetical protein [Caldilineaceae bacterium]
MNKTQTYFIQASLGGHFHDYYVEAKSIDEALKLARKLYAEEYDVQCGMTGFIQVTF